MASEATITAMVMKAMRREALGQRRFDREAVGRLPGCMENFPDRKWNGFLVLLLAFRGQFDVERNGVAVCLTTLIADWRANDQ